MSTLSLDIETYSECDLKKCGVFRYAEDPTTEILVACYAFDDGPVETWVPELDPFVPQRLFDHIKSKGRVSAFNAQFERVVLNGAAGERVGFPKLSIDQMSCSMAKARVAGLPGSLEMATKAFGTHAKKTTGVMYQVSKPRRGKEKRYTRENAPDKFAELDEYCADDVRAERELDKGLPDLTANERQIWKLDQVINQRGIRVDEEAIHNLKFLVSERRKKLVEFCVDLTGLKPTQTGKLADWIRSHGYPQLRDLQAATVNDAQRDPGCPDRIKKVLRVYSAAAMKAVSKLDSMLSARCSDGRIRGMLQHYGGSPGRWSGRLVQVHNFLRPLIDDPMVAIEACAARDLDYIKWMYGIEPMKVFASCMRGMLIPGEGNEFISRDFAQIEARLRCWIAGQNDMLNVFRSGVKHYPVVGSKMFGIPAEQIVDSGEEQLYTASKIGDLACGFQGWKNAVSKMARDMGIELSIPAEEIASRWREANPRVVQVWADLEEAASMAVRHSGTAFKLKNGRAAFKVIDRWLCMRLPSGRLIRYLDPEIDDERGVTYMGTDTYTRKWTRVEAYGGRWLQNFCEGTGRDILVNGMFNFESAGYPVVLTVHDELLAEVPKGYGSDEEVDRLVVKERGWFDGLPVGADGWRGWRYRKK